MCTTATSHVEMLQGCRIGAKTTEAGAVLTRLCNCSRLQQAWRERPTALSKKCRYFRFIFLQSKGQQGVFTWSTLLSACCIICLAQRWRMVFAGQSDTTRLEKNLILSRAETEDWVILPGSLLGNVFWPWRPDRPPPIVQRVLNFWGPWFF